MRPGIDEKEGWLLMIQIPGERERPERCGYTSTNMQRESETDKERKREKHVRGRCK